MAFETAFTRMLGIEHPIVQAPMAGGPTTPELVAAVSNAGGLGSLAAAFLPPDAIREAVRKIRALTDRPFNVNLFAVQPPRYGEAEIARANAALRPWRDALGLAEPPAPRRIMESFDEQAAVLVEERVPVVSFTFGIPDAAAMRAFREAGCRIIGTATTVAEGRALAAAGVDVVCAQGAEAGGHRGSFLKPFEESLVGTMALVPQMADALDLPVIAAGGIMDGRGVAAALTLGAAGAQLGTAFLGCPESGASPVHKDLLATTADDGTMLTRAYSGRPARGIANRFMREMAEREAEIAPYPLQQALMADIRQAAAAAGRTELLSFWAGQGASLARRLPAGDLVAALVTEMRAALSPLVSAAGRG